MLFDLNAIDCILNICDLFLFGMCLMDYFLKIYVLSLFYPHQYSIFYVYNVYHYSLICFQEKSEISSYLLNYRLC